MQRIVIGVGIPGSGKTTVLKSLAEADGLVYVCPDAIREELTGSATDQSATGEAWRLAYERIAEALSVGKGIVVDATNTEADKRKELVEWCRLPLRQLADRNDERSLMVELWFFGTSLEVCLDRNAKRDRHVPEWVLKKKWQQLFDQPVDMEREGFDVLVLGAKT